MYCKSVNRLGESKYFTEEVIKRNNLDKNLDSQTKEIVKPQDAKTLVNSLGHLKGVPKAITDLVASIDHVYYGSNRNSSSHELTVDDFFSIVNSL